MNDMTDHEKSVLLAKAMGWKIAGMDKDVICHPDTGDLWCYSFYAPANMSLAWRVHLWMLDQELNKRESPYAVSPKPYTRWWNGNVPWMMVNAQRLWLDKILTLAIEAGIVEVDDD